MNSSSMLMLLLLVLVSVSCVHSALPSTTNWDSIDPNILKYFNSSIPSPPKTYIGADFSSFESNPFTTFTLTASQWTPNACGLSLPNTAKFPQQGIEYGSTQANGAATACRVGLGTNNVMVLYNKREPVNTTPVSANPTWAQFRFPVPPRSELGQPLSLRINLDPRRGGGFQLYAYGGNPCMSGSTPECNLRIEGQWSRTTAAGYWVLLGTPSAGGYMIMGPYLDDPELNIQLPSEFKDASIKEIDVVIFAFNTYPYKTECDSTQPIQNCYIYEHKSLGIVSVSILNGLEFTYNSLPDPSRPRLFGNHSYFWQTKVNPFYTLPCDSLATLGIGVKSVRDSYETVLFSGSSCRNNRVATLRQHTLAKKYFDGTVTWDQYNQYNNGLNVMYVIRFLRSCFALGRNDCYFSQADLDALVPLFIAKELSWFSNWVWSDPNYGDGYGPFGFDLGSKGPCKYWSVFYDLFYNDLAVDQRALVSSKIDEMAANFRRNYKNRSWNIWNGNNWTPVLSSGAIYLSVARWYENSTLAQGLLTDILSVMYRTRYTIASDGVFVEGLAHYTSMNVDNIIEMDMLISNTFGIHLESPRWNYFETSYKWILDAILVDGLTMDFGDSHITQYGSLTPIYSMYIREILQVGTANVDPCAVAAFWINNYFNSGFDIGYDYYPVMARNWSAVVRKCPSLGDKASLYPVGGNGMFRRRVVDNGYAIDVRRQLEGYTGLALEAKYNGYPHTESDFGGIIWSGFGSRFVSDMSYGTIAKDDKTLQLDNGGGGASTMVVEDAWDSSKPTIVNKGQFSPVRGTIEKFNQTVDGLSIDYFKLDGSDVFGRNRSADGWLKRMLRYAISVPGGHYILVDSFTKHDRLQSVSVSEYFYSNRVPTYIATCGMWVWHTEPSLVSQSEIELRPKCNDLAQPEMATSVGRIVGASVSALTSFVVDGNITFESQAPINTVYRTRYSQSAPVSSPDARVFLMTAAKNQTSLPATRTVTKLGSCVGALTCFEVTVGASSYRIELSSDSVGYNLECVRPKVGGTYSSTPCSPVSTTTTTSSSTTTLLSTTTTTTTSQPSSTTTTTNSPTTTTNSPTTSTQSSTTTTSSTTTGLSVAVRNIPSFIVLVLVSIVTIIITIM
ncbi:hypothetical protein SAMD00019534_026070 [Acytostelium subglobosum LB1]|uniref:hypothetical protein n=1 Tax=Acytostelium subglobosum LB1 TaxID=1410327 RepID=UPI000644E4D9|nr:hypothetical protein SAMD00019534_026070 [Acytostelium subglobosum LB1]GAM19432.1 hypothetical protein SAMD00019534_026070 [Acytostelium subglobosum LB1]|eukprot:XP_012757359.1 hypothetical protein SAMD00019534_026070 [Acytostelium subglobosum LB1]